MRFWGSIPTFKPDGVPSPRLPVFILQKFKSCNNVGLSKGWNIRKSSPRRWYFSFYIYFIDEIMRTTPAKFQAKILNTVGSRAPWRWRWRFDLLVGGSCMFPMTSQCNSIGGDVDFTMICFTDITESLWPVPLRQLSCHCHLDVCYCHLKDFGLKQPRAPGLLWPLETPNIYAK